MSNHWRTTLNNWLQGRYRTTEDLTWEEMQVGPAHECYWTVIAYIRDVEHGRGTGVTKGAAAEEAARQTVVALRGF